ncbi:hypothetical protein MesoLjLc_05910 [Mesorhizobium sp. L-8-10]|uniref:BA14K family protein n=1 Tax=Mesorhizobium sp. L-8-10 TaxID=2744523 RepID=UPI001927DDBA|nr:BA14K family protein [Mesorhizobium sp. L-8-10]BCH28661.1 hypothetical protein MesoLjLc_05910 [Mesorhizobium sp. L-8-10]
MRKVISAVCAAVFSVTGVMTIAPASAAPIQRPLKLEQSSDVQQVRQRRGYYHYHGRPYYNGHRGYRYQRPGWRSYNGWWFPPAAFITGAIIGGAIAQPAPVYRPPSGSAHVQWCYNRYRSYRAYDNTFQPYHGPRQQCYSPYR